jgi:peptide/nickel transport system substrate-binding protein
VYHSKKLNNFVEFKTSSYEFYRTYPYRTAQWWLSE